MNFFASITAIWQKTTLMQRAMLVAVIMACGISAVMLTKWAKTPNMRLLYQDVDAQEAAKITEKIAEKGIAYELRGGGTSIYVPQGNVYQLRLDLAREGLPSGDRGGYKLFDDEKIGISPFVQGVNLNRALQDELAKTIQMIDGVVYVRVHLVRPEQALFGSSDSRTSASVVLRLKPGLNLSESNIAAITHLVAGSVEGLKFENVTVVDSAGKLLSRAGDETLAAGAGTALEYKERLEQNLAKKAQDMLTHVLGPGRATVSVSAVVNMTSSNHTKETYDPTSKIATKEEIKNKSEVGATSASSQAQAASSPTTKDETINTEYVVGKIVEQKTELPGEIMSLAVSAVVDLSPEQAADANAPAAAAAPVMTLKDVEEIIRNAVGLKSTDSLKVVNAKFNRPQPAVDIEQEYQQSVKWNRYIEIARQSSLGLLAISALLVLKIFSGARKRAELAMPAMNNLPTGAAAGLLNAGQYNEEPMALRAQIAGALERNPEEVKRLFSNWVDEKGEQFVATTGIHKAAILLMSLDATTASELLKGLHPDAVTNIAVELAYLDATGYRGREQSFAVAREFCDTLKKSTGGPQIKKFLGKMLESSVGVKKAGEIQSQIDDLVKKRDPFIRIRSASPEKLAYALHGEHPQAAALVLSELSTKKSSEVLALLNSDLQQKAVRRMTNPEYISPETKLRIANLILKHIEPAAAGAAQPGAAVSQFETKKTQRKLAILLRGLPKELRDGLVGSIKQNDEDAAQMVKSLMVTWEDIPVIQDRPLQEGLRSIESQKLAKGLLNADAAIIKKIRANISERAAALLDEETSLLSAPKKEDIQAARDEVVATLRQMNDEGKLAFAEE